LLTEGVFVTLDPAITFHEGNHLPYKVTLSFVIPSEAEGSAVPRTLPGDVFLVVSKSAAAFGNKGVVGKEEAGRTLGVLAYSDSRRDQDVTRPKVVVSDLQIGFQ
jgi:hypothetical protein